MRTILISIMLLTCAATGLQAQQLYIDGFLSRNRSNYGTAPYQNSNYWYSLIGGRFALGADHVQIGAEYHQHLTDPLWVIKEDGTGSELGDHTFNTQYYGLFLRSKISKYPARRFGVTVMGGAGSFQMQRTSNLPNERSNASYDNTLGFTGGIGISAPLVKVTMIELGYHYYYVRYKATDVLPDLNGGFHSVQLGLSLNFVFGKRAEKYQAIKGG